MSSSPFASANVSHTPSFDQNQDSQNLDDLQIDLQALDMDEESESDDIFDTMQQEFAEAHQSLKRFAILSVLGSVNYASMMWWSRKVRQMSLLKLLPLCYKPYRLIGLPMSKF